ncbi:thioredoxin family protein [Solemya velum gill symbiont]|uniref:Glutaredoxin n=2 Tax=Solemya velum gill symbiont TaxID=2340 RepID=A0A0B0H3C4_SOVGS|nr:thioredoxin family protein [Solemya velum gill symbiont]KHF24718.1 glutaredoxin [Solemya velum gill symbiont]
MPKQAGKHGGMQNENSLPELDQYNFHHRISEMTGRTVVFFTSPDCGACRAARFALSSLHEKSGLQVYEVDAVMNPALTNEFGFFHLPSLYLYIDGDYHAQIQSEANPDSMAHAIETFSALPAEEEP